MSRYDIMVFPSAATTERVATYTLVEDDNGDIQGLSGLPQLVTTIIRDMLSERTPTYQGGTELTRLVGGVYDPSEVKALILREMLGLSESTKKRQSGADIDSSERLASLSVTSIDDSTPGEIIVRILVTSEAGDSATADVEI